MSQLGLFTVADDLLQPFIALETFERSLLLNVLFQERVLINEAYLYDSKLLAQHVGLRQKGKSLFEAASRKGLIMPAFLNPQTRSMADSYKDMQSRYGTDFRLVIPEIAPLRARIESAVEYGLATGQLPLRKVTSGTFGARFLSLVNTFVGVKYTPELRLPKDPGKQQLFRRVWKLTEKWRFDLIEQAAVATEAKCGTEGLQRTELYRLLYWHLGGDRRDTTIRTEDLLQQSKHLHETHLAVEMFVKWIAQCHHLAQSEYYGALTSFPLYDSTTDFVADSLISPELQGNTSVERLKLPSFRWMLSAGVDRVIRARREYGTEYFDALRHWEDCPCETTFKNVKESLQEYASQIGKSYGAKPIEWATVFSNAGNMLPQASAIIGLELGRATMASANIPTEQVDLLQIPGALWSFYVIGKSAFGLFRWSKNRPRQQLVEINVKNSLQTDRQVC